MSASGGGGGGSGVGYIGGIAGDGDALMMDNSLTAIHELHSAVDLDEYQDALLNLSTSQLVLEVKWWSTHLSMLAPTPKSSTSKVVLQSPFIRAQTSKTTASLLEFHELSIDVKEPFSSPYGTPLKMTGFPDTSR